MPDDSNLPLPPSGPPLGGDREIAFRKPRGWWRKHLSGLIAVGVVIVLVGGVTGAYLATRNIGDITLAEASASPSPSAAPSSHAPTTTAPAPPKPTGPAKANATGTVVAVIATGRWTVAFEKGLELTVVTNGATKYLHKIKPTDVKKNVTIDVVGTLAGSTITAASVDITKKKK